MKSSLEMKERMQSGQSTNQLENGMTMTKSRKNVEDLAEHKACCATGEVLWKPPLEGTVMMNTDAALQKKNRSGRGSTARNHE